jgi:predicted dehydrogenase
MNPIPIAFIGGSQLSAVGNTHRIAAEMDNRFQLVAGCFSRDSSINHETAANWGVDKDRTYNTWNDLLAEEKRQDIVLVLLTPTPHHTEVLDSAISEGYRVICEKSVTTSVASIRALSEKVRESTSSFHAVYNYTGYPMIRELREIINSGEIGTLLHCEIEMPQEGFLRRTADGAEILPQQWRRHDDFIPTVSLDLGIHVVNLFRFVTGQGVRRIIGSYQSKGNVPNVVDRVSALADCTNEVKADFRFGKTSLGHSNGLSITCFGTRGSAKWIQMNPEFLFLSDSYGQTSQIHRGSNACQVALLPRYNRFKAGHPSGFLEAFSNHYFDIADDLLGLAADSKFTFSASDAIKDMSVLDALSESVRQDRWVDVEA